MADFAVCKALRLLLHGRCLSGNLRLVPLDIASIQALWQAGGHGDVRSRGHLSLLRRQRILRLAKLIFIIGERSHGRYASSLNDTVAVHKVLVVGELELQTEFLALGHCPLLRFVREVRLELVVGEYDVGDLVLHVGHFHISVGVITT